ncbi:MAG TPA: hypothetical protein PKL30_25745 [Leptospiraceae bacterium]|nr:hypothetical protein [Leptospiraceae bacterium]HMZ67032.1 hypothetical protein [Leptospiraceae bacterium]HNA10249.1 hypothetical protein [Leptospiraceae bacterium]HNC59559.1 hypothetical protein [Leptospiraceae bacterium]HNE11407.1 hypothetical protein [Leptospiraceae bacterium]
MQFDVGPVYRWDKFLYKQGGGSIKPRWLIYLGNSGIIAEPKLHLFCTTTTSYFPERKDRAKLFPELDYSSIFTNDCYLYFDEKINHLYDYQIEPHKKDIEFKGELRDKDLNEIYLGYWIYKISPIFLTYIKNSLENKGILNLPTPKKNI